MAEKKLVSPNIILAKSGSGYICTFSDPKKALGVDSEVLKLYMIIQILEAEGKEYYVNDILKIANNKTVSYKEFLSKTLPHFDSKLLKGIESIKVENTTVLVPVSEGKPRNIGYDCVNDIGAMTHFDLSKNVMLNMKSFNAFIKSFDFPNDFMEYIQSMPLFNSFLVKNNFTITEDTKKIYTIHFIGLELYKYFYTGIVHKNIIIFLNWLKEFSINYEVMLMSIKVAEFYIKNIEGLKSIKSGQLGAFYYDNKSDIEKLIVYTSGDFENIKALLVSLSSEYKKENLSFNIKTIVKNMYKYVIPEKSILLDVTYPKEFIEKMKILGVKEENYGKYFEKENK